MSESIVLGGGCFWCLEASYKLINGVEKVVSGYSGGTEEDAEYGKVSTGFTDHAEVVRVEFDSSKVTLDDVLDIFWTIHDPTTLNKQGNDVGKQYRSAIFYADNDQLKTIKSSLLKAQQLWRQPIVTEVVQLQEFYPAETYHQDYFINNPEKAYCQLVINPKLDKLRDKFSKLIKKE